ncbi:MAG: hypothetical protein R2695_06810 [Acidimicrobiales bacterium]
MVMAWAGSRAVVTIGGLDGPAVLAGLVMAGACSSSVSDRPVSPGPRRAAVGSGAAGVGMVAAVAWRPCVGVELASVVNDAPGGRLASGWSTLVYVTGTALPLLALAAAISLVPGAAERLDRRLVIGAGIAAGGVVAVAMMSGTWDEWIDELFIRSSA